MISHIPKQREFGRAETIAERKAKREYDRLHPWSPINLAKIDGSVCELQFCDMVGNFDAGDGRFVLSSYPPYQWKRWLRLNPPGWAFHEPIGFRQTGRVLDELKIRNVKRIAGRY